jgi:hypothetical protein
LTATVVVGASRLRQRVMQWLLTIALELNRPVAHTLLLANLYWDLTYARVAGAVQRTRSSPRSRCSSCPPMPYCR